MCVAATGKVVKIDNEIAEVDFNGNIVRAHTGIIDVKVGDNVLVHAGLIIQVWYCVMNTDTLTQEATTL